LLNALAGTSLVAGDLVDIIETEGGASTSDGGAIETGLVYALDPLAFDDESPDNYPPNPDDVLTKLFYIEERDDQEETTYSGYVLLDESGTQYITINAGHAGAWFNPDTSGQGQLIDVEPEEQFIFVAWFTYGEDSALGQRWLTAQGPLGACRI
jgi:hypothetical protein